MITLPDRLGQLVNEVERGGEVDLQRLAALQVLDVVRMDRQFVEAAIVEHERADSELIELLRGTAT